MKTRTREEQIENLRMAYSIMAGIPEEKINLNKVRGLGSPYSASSAALNDHQVLHNCGAVACIAGFLSAHPYFKAQGLRYSPLDGVMLDGSEDNSLASMSRELFGHSGVFNASNGLWGGHQKAEALVRIRSLLSSLGAITPARYNFLARQEQGLPC